MLCARRGRSCLLPGWERSVLAPVRAAHLTGHADPPVPGPSTGGSMRAQAAVLPGLGDAPRKPKGGYRLIPVVQLCMAWSAYRAGLIRLFDLRVYFACHEMVARRCLSAKTSLPSCFTLKELDRLTGLGAKRLKGSLGRLTAARLLIWSEAAIAFPGSAEGLPEEGRKVLTEMLDRIPNHERLVPVPRRTLRLLAGGARPALIATILGHLFRCLYLKKGCCQARGRCKASWIARVFGVGERRVKEARKELIHDNSEKERSTEGERQAASSHGRTVGREWRCDCEQEREGRRSGIDQNGKDHRCGSNAARAAPGVQANRQ
jgi:hypothetical protein